MTNEKAIEILNPILESAEKRGRVELNYLIPELIEALQMAIKSLREPKGVIPIASVSVDIDWKRIERMVERQVKECTFEWSEDHKDQIIGWLSKFCFHIDMIDKHLTDDEAREFWKKKMHDQFGW